MTADAGVRPAAAAGRLVALDGLRGAAAVVVALHHTLLLVPSLAAVYLDPEASTPSWARWFVDTPLHLLWGGTEAVYLFFVLSGVVLARQARGFTGGDWAAYVPSRLARLYLPVVAIVLLVAAVGLVAPPPVATGNLWLDLHPARYETVTLVRDLVLIEGTSGVITPLWTLRWEVLFSLLLALAVVVVRPRWGLVAVPGALALVIVGFLTGVSALCYLPMFLIGAAIGTRVDALVARAERARTWARHAAGVALVAGGVVLATAYWLYPAPDAAWFAWSRPLVVLGVVGILLAALVWSPFEALLASRPFRLLGAFSFSLYLVHEPIVVAVGRALPVSAGALVFAFALSLGAAAGFGLLVEQPAHRLARTLRERLAPRLAG